jgi:hypothetical protein
MQIAERRRDADRRLGRAPALATLETAVLVAIGAAKLAVHLLTNANYGFHRDSLYYLASARHLAPGYVDYPPLTPLLARLSLTLFGPSVFGLRLFPALAGAVIVVLTGLIARELGGGRFAQALAATAALASPLLLGANWLFQTVTLDQLAWTVSLLLAARLVRSGDPRWWLAIGLVVGIGLETKYTILALAAGLLVGALAWRGRGQLLTPWPWIGALIALLILLPNLVWQVQHGWPSLQYVLSHPRDQARDFSPTVVLLEQVALVGPLALPLWLAGWHHLLRRSEVRLLGVAALVAFGIFVFVGKSYYPGPLYPLLLAAGAVAAEELTRRRATWSRPLVAAAVVANGLLLLPLLVPLVPVSQLDRYQLDAARKDFADTVGWPEITDQVAAVYDSLPPDERASATILAANYGEAGAIDLYGPSRGLPGAICPHLTYWYWKPAHVDDRTVVVVGYPADLVRRYFADVEPVATIRIPDGVRNEELGRPIIIARQPRVPLDKAWSQLKQFD